MSGVVRALALGNGAIDATGLLSYGLTMQHQGRAEEASQVFQAVVENFPSPVAHAFLVYPQLLCDDSDARHSAVARDWAQLYAPAVPQPRHANPDLAGRKLHIGYLAPNFSGSQLRQFIAPVLESHDPEKVSVTLYPAAAETETAWPAWIRVRPIGPLSDADAADLIRRDGADVLADCWGHSAGSRLAVFARRPAPVQVAWINFLTTTGLDQIDYVLHAAGATPADAAATFTEDIWTLGPVFNAFRPAAGRLAPAPTPALAAGHVTFGSFNHPAKLSDRTTLDALGSAVLRTRGAFERSVLLAQVPLLRRSGPAAGHPGAVRRPRRRARADRLRRPFRRRGLFRSLPGYRPDARRLAGAGLDDDAGRLVQRRAGSDDDRRGAQRGRALRTLDPAGRRAREAGDGQPGGIRRPRARGDRGSRPAERPARGGSSRFRGEPDLRRDWLHPEPGSRLRRDVRALARAGRLQLRRGMAAPGDPPPARPRWTAAIAPTCGWSGPTPTTPPTSASFAGTRR